MEYLVGAVLALFVCTFATLAGFGRNRAFYPTLLAFVASFYAVFAVVARSGSALAIDTGIATIFLALAVAGFKKNLWLVVAALAGHGVLDFFHQALIPNPGVPIFWPGFCLSFDVLASGFLAWTEVRDLRQR